MRSNSLFFLLCAPLLVSCAARHSARVGGVVEIYDTRARVLDREFFFNEEYELIRQRRALRSLSASGPASGKPPRLVGLALSGGGIRSNAFNLGLLSGLHASGALPYVDYLSAVSGGSWAAGNYRSMDYQEDYFFNSIDAALKDPASHPDQNPLLRGLLFSYAEPVRALQVELLKAPGATLLGLATRLAHDRTIQNVWRAMIRRNFLGGHGASLGDLAFAHRERPLTIVNAAHDTAMTFEEAGDLNARFSRNFPFEFAPFAVGTLADCGNTSGYCTDEHRRDHTQRCGVFWDPRAERGRRELDRVLAISSSWLPGFFFLQALRLAWLEWDEPGPPARAGASHRATFQLTDGGHSENLGGLPLLERGVGLLVLADATIDPEYRFSDFELFQKQANSLLGANVALDTLSEFWNDAEETVLFGRARTGGFAGLGGDRALVLTVKPKDTPGFRQYLRTGGYGYIADFLEHARHSFPHDATITVSYPPELIRAYYLLGRYSAARRAGPLLRCYAQDPTAFPDRCGSI